MVSTLCSRKTIRLFQNDVDEFVPRMLAEATKNNNAPSNNNKIHKIQV